jgi:phosphoribosyl-ATP pyrophosphohydrolase/phosphoribosyl-AMP cyclohydrolase
MKIEATDIERIDWGKQDGLVPAIVQDQSSGAVLMLGYMTRAALQATFDRQRVVFFSRSKQRLWEKGETSGHYLDPVAIHLDCDADTLLVFARPHGPACHTGADSCFNAGHPTDAGQLTFLRELEDIVDARIRSAPDGSYTSQLVAKGVRHVARKVGEEGLEVALAGAGEADPQLIGEAADLLFHLVVLLRTRGMTLQQVVAELRARHAARS